MASAAVVTLTACAVVSTLGSDDEAAAFNPLGNANQWCPDTSLTYQFDTVTLAWGGRDAYISNGIQRMNTPRAQDASQLAVMTRSADYSSGTPTADVLIIRDAATPHNGLQYCAQTVHGRSMRTVRINDSLSADGTLQKTGIHEMLHHMGMEHGGGYDSFLKELEGNQVPGLPPRNATCSANNLPVAGLTADDIGLMAWLSDDAPERQLSADSGFEVTVYDPWERPNTPVFQWVNTPGASGNYRMRVRHNSGNTATDYVQQKTGLLTGNATANFRAYARIGPNAPSDYVDSEIRFYTRSATFGGNNSCEYGNSTLNAVDPNTLPTFTTPWTIRRTDWLHLSPGWQTLDTDWYTIPAAHRVDMAVRINALASNASGATTYWLDNVSVERDI